MPGMNGRELADKLLANRPQMHCLFISDYTANVMADHGVLDEGIALLNKPFNRNELANKVREVLTQPTTPFSIHIRIAGNHS